ncbi:MAG: hypothetical protein ABMA64_24205 [Myxococcota bacterium]
MRLWALAVIGSSGCVVYRSADSTWSSTSSSSSTWTDPAPSAGPHGEVEVSWQVGAGGCEAAGVDTVEVDLDGRVDAFPCADGGAVVEAETGKYDLVLRGIDVDGVARYGGWGGKVRVNRGEVTEVPTIVLAALPATVTATWYFDNGHLCAANGVTEVEANLFDEDDTLHATASSPCDDGTLTLDDVQTGPYVLLLLGRDASGDVTYSAQQQLSVLGGDAIGLDIMLLAE